MGTKIATGAAAQALLKRAEARRVRVLSQLDVEAQNRLGQYFTPEAAASLIVGLPQLPAQGRLRLLDPGAGSGSLTAAVAARILAERPGLDLEIVAVELDEAVADALAETLIDIEDVLLQHGHKVSYQLVRGDFIRVGTGFFDRSPALLDPFDLVIMNPPYSKLAASSTYRQSLIVELGVECPNIYAAFLAVGTALLGDGGQVVAITPRSFANGTYFSQFRGWLLDRVSLDRLHVFESRSTVFSDTGVLQENIVFSATSGGPRKSVALSISTGHTDEALKREVGYDEVVAPTDRARFIRIPADEDDTSTAASMTALPASLKDLGVQVSTGRVVDFRSRPNLTTDDHEDAVPLIYPGNVRAGGIIWPRDIKKPQGFVATDASSARLLLPSGNYVVVKRFSAKEERRRVVAGVWLADQSAEWVAFENHLNIFHSNGAGLDLELAIGLSYWLNSSLVDKFFRTFSGHTQVNAGDLKSLRFPSVVALRRLGRGRSLALPDQALIDEAVADVAGLQGAAA